MYVCMYSRIHVFTQVIHLGQYFNMLASKVERMMCIRLNRHMFKEVRELDAANALVRARAAKAAQKSEATQDKRSNVVVDLSTK